MKELADELLQAEDSRIGIPPFTERYANLSVEDAYNIQLEVVERKLENGRCVIGKKLDLRVLQCSRCLG